MPRLPVRPVPVRRDYPTAGTVLAGLAAASAAMIFIAPGPVALAGALLLTLVLPGAALTRALFPGRRLSTAEWFALVPALSLGTLVLGGLGLHVARIGLTRPVWCLLAALVTVVAAVTGQVRARRAAQMRARRAVPPVGPRPAGSVDLPRPRPRPRPGRSTPPSSRPPAPSGAGAPALSGSGSPVPSGAGSPAASAPHALPVALAVGSGPRVTFRRAVLRLAPLVLAAGLLAGAGWYSLRAAGRQSAEPFTALAMVPAFASEAPGPTRTVSIGIQCHEHADTDYLVRVRGAGRFEQTLRARLRPDEAWARRIAVPGTGRVTVDLFKDGGTAPYRTVYLDNPQ